ncbi:tyrosine recombinase xerc [Plakobranchus ocellatus]|uniref:Tyrosine recombinase xerc n=1 Tax=Plakobranchus ocellatus TaxID=259542 RepID=A0AAV4AL67_9GAST|nr:tyrosine recombinase xerc [Plakobranchus ocellatus]
MTVTLSGDKREHVETLTNKVLLTPMITVRTLAQTVGTLIACFPAIEYEQLYHRHLEILKMNSLKTVYDFERLILLSEEAMSDLKWWLNDGLKSKKSLVREKPRATIKSESSGYAWGAVMNNTDSDTSNNVTHGMWRDDERKEHINVLELKAAMLAVQSLCRELTDCHVRIEIDNTTAVAYINSMGGTNSLKCNDIIGHRCQTFHAMDIKHMQISEGKATFHIAPLLKTNSPKNPISTITLRAYREDRRICVFTCLKLYLKRTKHLRSTTQLFIGNYSPHSAVTKDTLARWIKSMLNKAGIDTNVYKAHSTRAAASSAAARSIDIAQVLNTAGWSRKQTFAKFYNKPVQTESASAQFDNSVLNSKSVSL